MVCLYAIVCCYRVEPVYHNLLFVYSFRGTSMDGIYDSGGERLSWSICTLPCLNQGSNATR